MATRSAVEAVTDEIRRRLWEGQLIGGDRIPQDDIADTLGVSRIPVREALIGLERDGAVEITPRRGARVVTVTEQGVRDHYELYGLIDAFALGKTLERASEAELGALEASIGAVTEADGPDALQSAVATLRTLIHRVGGSPRLAAVRSGLRGFVPGNFFAAIPGSDAIVRDGCTRVTESIRRGDRQGACEAYAAMMAAHADCVIPVMSDRGLLA